MTTSDHQSVWQATYQPPRYQALKGDVQADVAIVGAGITGLTTALLLQRAGKKVVVIEQDRIGSGTSGKTTAHLTAAFDSEYYHLAKSYGDSTAREVCQSMQEAIDLIEQLSEETGRESSFERVTGYYYAEPDQDFEAIRKEFDAAGKAGLDVAMMDDIPLPFPVRGGFAVKHQGQLHATAYLAGLAEAFVKAGGEIYEQTSAFQVEDGGAHAVMTRSGIVAATDVVLATHTPLGLSPLHTVVAPYRSYALAIKIPGPVPQGLFWDTAEPYNYIRRQWTNEGELLIVGGKDHKTAHGNEDASFAKLREYVAKRFPNAEIVHEWSAQFYEPADGLPFIGLSPFAKHTYVATGFSGDGMTLGTVAGRMIADLITVGTSPYASIYRPTRINFAGSRDFIKENADVAIRFVRDRLRREDVSQIQNLERGEGVVIGHGGSPVAAYRTESGELKAYSAVCKHMKCVVRWNNAEKSFDCPCHGARYNLEGEPIEGPAMHNLTMLEERELLGDREATEAPDQSA